ncbi:hypothetical protein E2L07_12360 [Halalkalibacterium halodurans]|uniref:lipopolysaccharide biosynthesis protein n=1 Tax=Halalkalibacterium halodurans TaxID=86665 RepID=UPI001067B7EA|nr:oligosaccharide flippase family protein [Halalkalibacterium halodurans]TES53594.1 hypothetical protein E2L07_12360 [Halalkalibacterium halodurans]
MKSLVAKLIKKTFVRNVIIVATGTAAAQFVTIILSPIITRLYGPEAFGLLGVFTAVIAIIVPIATLTYPIAIVLPRSDNEAKGIVRLSIYISLIIAIITALFLLTFHQSIVQLFNLEAISSFLFLIPIVIVFSGVLQVTEQWLIRKKQFKVTAKVTFLQAIFIQGSKVGIGLINPIAAVLIIITVIGQILKPVMMIIFVKRSPQSTTHVVQDEDPEVSIKKLAKEHKDFPLFRAPEVLLNAISQGLPILMLTSFFGPASAGFYSLGKTVLSAPSQLLGKSVTDVFYPRISEASKNGENLYALIKKSTLALGVIGLIPFGIIVVFSPYIFGLIFGAGWEVAGEYTRWLAIWSYIGFMNRPSVAAIPVLSAQLFFLKYSVISILLRLGALATGYFVFSSDLVAVAFFGIMSALLNLVLILYTLNISKGFNKGI